jgi:opacity protein-like surface antigen
MVRTLIAGLVLLSVCSPPAIAGMLKAPSDSVQWRVDVSGGAIVAPWAVHLPKSSPDLHEPGDARFDTGGSYAVGGSYLLTDRFELGGQFQHSLSRGVDAFTVPGRRPTEAVPRNLTSKPTLDVFSFTVGPRIHLLPANYRVRLWFVGQAGWYRVEGAVDEGAVFHDFPYAPNGSHIRHSGADNGFGFNVGGGIDMRVTRLVAVGADIRYHRTVNVLDNVDFITTMLNLSFHF